MLTSTMMNLADPELELIDPTPNVHSMFLHFDKTFFWAKLSSRCVVRWSKRMYSCAGICSYEGRGGLCDIALSEPLLKLRPRKDLVETLLHEMIHAYLFISHKDQDRNGHGPNFQAHMHRINRAAGLNISIYHDFHDEVKLYQTHWWRCDGPCQRWKPFFGVVRRPMNRAPGKSDYWWKDHKLKCGGTFVKIKEPAKPEKKGKNANVTNPNADIRKYINNNNNKEVSNKNHVVNNNKSKNPILQDKSNLPVIPKVGVKSNTNSTIVVTKKNVIFNPQVPKPVPFSGTGQTISGKHQRTSSDSVIETVREAWINRQLGTNNTKIIPKDNNSVNLSKPSKHKPEVNTKTVLNTSTSLLNPSKHKADIHSESPPPKMKKINDYFTSRATSVLKDLYGQNFNVTQSDDNQKLIAKTTKIDSVDCPVCNSKVDSDEINRHLDECLNKDVIKKLHKDKIVPVNESDSCSHNAEKKDNKGITAVSPKLECTKATTIKKIKEETIHSDRRTKKDIIDAIAQLNKIPIIDIKPKIKKTSLDNSNIDIGIIEHKVKIKEESDSFRNIHAFIVPHTPNNLQNSTITVFSSNNVNQSIKIEPGCSKTDSTQTECPCCGDKLNKSVDEHLDECLSFFDKNSTTPEEGASKSFTTETIVIDDDDDDQFDETLTMNATGTKLPCPCCLKMVEEIDMNNHLDICLS